MKDTNTEREIRDAQYRIDSARLKKQREVMEGYDRTVYYPAMKALYARCEASGHIPGRSHDNGFGWTSVYCSLCGGILEQRSHDRR